MKPMKVAAVVAGSLVALGAASPAFASDVTPSSLNTGLDTLASDGLRSGSPLNSNALDTENKGSLVNAVKNTTDSLNGKKGTAAKSSTAKGGSTKDGSSLLGSKGAGSLLGGLPLGG